MTQRREGRPMKPGALKTWLGLLIMVGSLPPLQAAATEAFYLPSEPDDFRAIVGAPPTNASAEARREIDIVLREQSQRTAADVARIQAEAGPMGVAFSEVGRPKMTARQLPPTVALVSQVGKDNGERREDAQPRRKLSRAPG